MYAGEKSHERSLAFERSFPEAVFFLVLHCKYSNQSEESKYLEAS